MRRAVLIGGRPRDVALAKYPLGGLSWASDALLRELLPTLRGHRSGWGGAGRNRERVLCEMARRGGPAWEKVLADELSEIRAQVAAAREPADRFRPTPILETLAALRRVQDNADPLRVEVAGPAAVECMFPSLPSFAVALVNADPLKESVPFTQGGDYRSGRQARWRIEARDAAGKLMSLRPRGFGMGGGMYNEGTLAPGERWKTTLRAGSFIAALPPGRYAVRVLYHDSVCLADEEGEVDGLIAFASAPVTLTVKPLEVARADVDPVKVRGLLAAIDERAKLKVVAGTYDDWAHKLVPPDSPQGKLLAIGLPAVPTLLETLDDPKLTPGRRAVVLALLFSLTGQGDPRFEAGVVGGFDSAEGPWMIAGSDGSAGFGSGSMSLADGAKVDVAAQRAFAKRWEPWKGYVKVVPR